MVLAHFWFQSISQKSLNTALDAVINLGPCYKET